jgi:hypothetical protein
MVRRGPRHRLVEIADLLVIAAKHRVPRAQVQLHQRAMPPQMMDQVVATRPVRDLPGQPVASLPRAAFGLHHMSLHMMGEVVGAIDGERTFNSGFGDGSLARLLMGERPDA